MNIFSVIFLKVINIPITDVRRAIIFCCYLVTACCERGLIRWFNYILFHFRTRSYMVFVIFSFICQFTQSLKQYRQVAFQKIVCQKKSIKFAGNRIWQEEYSIISFYNWDLIEMARVLDGFEVERQGIRYEAVIVLFTVVISMLLKYKCFTQIWVRFYYIFIPLTVRISYFYTNNLVKEEE